MDGRKKAAGAIGMRLDDTGGCARQVWKQFEPDTGTVSLRQFVISSFSSCENIILSMPHTIWCSVAKRKFVNNVQPGGRRVSQVHHCQQHGQDYFVFWKRVPWKGGLERIDLKDRFKVVALV